MIGWDFAGLLNLSEHLSMVKRADIFISLANSGQQVGAARIVMLRRILRLCLRRKGL